METMKIVMMSVLRRRRRKETRGQRDVTNLRKKSSSDTQATARVIPVESLSWKEPFLDGLNCFHLEV